jgi:hypothetical protein
VAASRRGCTREIETEGGRVEVNDDGGKVDDDELEEEDGGGMLQVGEEVAACSGAEIEAVVYSEAGHEAAACSEAGDMVVACSKVGVKAAVCSEARISDGGNYNTQFFAKE